MVVIRLVAIVSSLLATWFVNGKAVDTNWALLQRIMIAITLLSGAIAVAIFPKLRPLETIDAAPVTERWHENAQRPNMHEVSMPAAGMGSYNSHDLSIPLDGLVSYNPHERRPD